MENRFAEFGVTGLVILAWLIIWKFALGAITRHNADSALAQGLANVVS